METNYYIGSTIPLCKTCNMELVSPKIFNKFRRSITKNGIGDNASLKGIRLKRKFTHIKKQGFAFACVWESQLKIENFLDLFYKHIKEYISNKLQGDK